MKLITAGKMHVKLPSKAHPITSLTIKNGIVRCPKCQAITVPLRYRKTETSERFIRRCMNGHIFASRRILHLEKCYGDVINLSEIIKKCKERYAQSS